MKKGSAGGFSYGPSLGWQIGQCLLISIKAEILFHPGDVSIVDVGLVKPLEKDYPQ